MELSTDLSTYAGYNMQQNPQLFKRKFQWELWPKYPDTRDEALNVIRRPLVVFDAVFCLFGVCGSVVERCSNLHRWQI